MGSEAITEVSGTPASAPPSGALSSLPINKLKAHFISFIRYSPKVLISPYPIYFIMGILTKLFKKSSKQEPVQAIPGKLADVSMENLVNWIESSNSVKIDHTRGQLEDLWSDVLNQVSALQLAIKMLEKAKFEPTDKTYAAINMTKDTFAKKSVGLNKIPKYLGRKFSEITLAYTATLGIISELKEANMKQAYIISNYFKTEAGQMLKILKLIDQKLSEIEKIMKSDGKILELIESASAKSDECRKINERLVIVEKSVADISDSIAKMSTETRSLKEDINRLLEGNEWEKLQSAINRSQEIDQSIERVKYDFGEFVSALNRPLKKVLHDADSLKLTKEQKSMLSSDADIENPEKLYNVISLIDSLSSENKINLKIDEVEKMSKLKNSITSDLGDLKEKYMMLVSEKKSAEFIQAENTGIEKQKKEKELKLMSIESEFSKSIFERDILLGEKKRLEQEKEKQKKELQKFVLEILGKEICLV